MGLAGQKLGNYELIAEIARGATTDLVLARTRGMAGFERHVVIKRVRDARASDAAFLEAFVTEARLAATLHHHNVVQVQDINEVNGVPYFAMEYVHGEDLRALLAHVHARKETIPIQHVLTIGCAVAAALHHAHEQKTPDGKPLNIVHRDVTPANILAGYDGNVKVVDFGMAKAAITSVTQVGIKKGRAPYMAPEQCTGQRVDRRTDVFALGIVLYELVTARRLFKGASDHDTMMTIVHGSMPPARVMRPDLPLELSAVIMKALARLPSDRFQSAAELGQALETYASATGVGISTTALAAYLKQQLGERREPWLPGGSVRAIGPIDFDGSELGVASPAGEAVATTPRREIPAAARSDEDADENEPTATNGSTKVKAEAPAKPAPAKPAAPKQLDPTAFAPKPAGAAKPLPSITRRAKHDTDSVTDVVDRTGVDDELAEEPPTSEMTRDEVAASLAGAGLAIAVEPVAPKLPAASAVAPTRPTPLPVAKIALAKAAAPPPANAAASTAKPAKLPPPVTTKSAPFAKPGGDADLEIPNESGMRPGTDLDVPAGVGDDPHDPRAETAEPLPAPPSTTAETAAGRPAKRTKSVSSEMSPTAAGGIVVETRRKTGADLTLQVTPLPLELPVTVVPDPRVARRRRLIVAGVGGIAVFAGIVAVIAFWGGASQAGAKPAEIVQVAEPAPAKPPEPEPAAAPPSGELTWNGVLDAGAGSAEVKQPDPAPEPVPASEPAANTTAPADASAPAIEPAAKPPEPVDEPAAKPKEPPPPPQPVKAAAVRPVKKPVAKPKPKPAAKPAPAKKATKPPDKPVQYDPNSLFLGK